MTRLAWIGVGLLALAGSIVLGSTFYNALDEDDPGPIIESGVDLSDGAGQHAAASGDTTLADQLADIRDPDIPDLPFADNPDPSQCGIPVAWGEDDTPAWLTGFYEGELIQPVVLLYNSHSRLSITGRAAHGSPVKIVLFQANPVLDYYMVRVEGEDGTPQEGWVPEPFISFEPVAPLP